MIDEPNHPCFVKPTTVSFINLKTGSRLLNIVPIDTKESVTCFNASFLSLNASWTGSTIPSAMNLDTVPNILWNSGIADSIFSIADVPLHTLFFAKETTVLFMKSKIGPNDLNIPVT